MKVDQQVFRYAHILQKILFQEGGWRNERGCVHTVAQSATGYVNESMHSSM